MEIHRQFHVFKNEEDIIPSQIVSSEISKINIFHNIFYIIFFIFGTKCQHLASPFQRVALPFPEAQFKHKLNK
jgi:hypothetical protein